MNVDEFFAKGGPLARVFKEYKPRPGQLELARAVEHAINVGGLIEEDPTRTILVAEAPVGVGKSSGYLAPVLLSGKTATVVTATLALQDQLGGKDLPMLQKALGSDIRWQVLKGTSNYLCGLGHSRSMKDPPHDPESQLPLVTRWAAKTQTGDLAELGFELSQTVRRALTVSAEECVGSKCPMSHTCHVLGARRKAREAQVVVVNYHLLYADAYVREVTGGAKGILPETDVLILDEAHRAADIARDCSGFRVTQFMVQWIARHLSGGRRGGGPHPMLGRDLDDAAERFFGSILAQVGRSGISEDVRDPGSENLCDMLRQGGAVLEEDGSGDPEVRETRHQAGKRAGELAFQIEHFFKKAEAGWAYWVETSSRRAELRASPLDVSPVMREIFGRFESVVLTSATLRDGKGFGLVERECGIAPDEGERLTVESPFDYSSSILLCPEGMPEANSPAYKPAAARLLEQVVERSGGRCLALFTSYAALEVAKERLLRSRLPFQILAQGEQIPRQELLRRFAADETSVLLGTDSFWEGVDVPGPALSVVFIDKLPFPRPDDPIVSKLIKLDGRKGYPLHAVGRAARKFKQGFGRLVRREGDFGVVVVADGRLFDASFSSRFLSMLPGAIDMTRAIDDIGWSAISGQ